jgi:CheY-like chemotaxis protein
MTRKPSAKSQRPGGRPSPSPAPRLLLIEDHRSLAEATAEFLRHEGFDVRVAPSGGEALQIAAEFLPEIVLCDMSLPDMSGIEVAQALRASPTTKKVLFAMHTAMSDADLAGYERLVSKAEVNLFLSKPLTEKKLETLLDALAAMDPPGKD